MSNSNAAFSLSTQLLFHVAESWDTLAEQHVLFCALCANNLTASSPKHNFNAITANFCVLWSPNLGLPCRTSEPPLLSDSESFLGSIKRRISMLLSCFQHNFLFHYATSMLLYTHQCYATPSTQHIMTMLHHAMPHHNSLQCYSTKHSTLLTLMHACASVHTVPS